jgi:serine/threonine protein kinase
MADSPEETKRSAAAHGFTALPQGTRLDGRYTIESVIAAGGFGITYLGRHDALAKECAIKEHFPRQPQTYVRPTPRRSRGHEIGFCRRANRSSDVSTPT